METNKKTEVKVPKAMGTCIVTCTCAHEYQDKTYGAHRRVANVAHPEKSHKGQAKCTVCDKYHNIK